MSAPRTIKASRANDGSPASSNSVSMVSKVQSGHPLNSVQRPRCRMQWRRFRARRWRPGRDRRTESAASAIDKAADQPGAGDAVDLGSPPRHPHAGPRRRDTVRPRLWRAKAVGLGPMSRSRRPACAGIESGGPQARGRHLARFRVPPCKRRRSACAVETGRRLLTSRGLALASAGSRFGSVLLGSTPSHVEDQRRLRRRDRISRALRGDRIACGHMGPLRKRRRRCLGSQALGMGRPSLAPVSCKILGHRDRHNQCQSRHQQKQQDHFTERRVVEPSGSNTPTYNPSSKIGKPSRKSSSAAPVEQMAGSTNASVVMTMVMNSTGWKIRTLRRSSARCRAATQIAPTTPPDDRSAAEQPVHETPMPRSVAAPDADRGECRFCEIVGGDRRRTARRRRCAGTRGLA